MTTYAKERVQDKRDKAHEATNFTGIAPDIISNDYQVWQGGQILSWAPTWGEAERKLIKIRENARRNQ